MFVKTYIMSKFEQDKSTRGIGGITLLGVGIGLAVLQTSMLLLVGSIIAGIGLGIVITAITSDRNI